jgi:4-diphosphocytidyl-2-C-methyl-D-erythritol kinase
MALTRESPCKVNLILNILGRRTDGFHELETVLYPVPCCDRIELERADAGLELTCSDPRLPTDATNLVHRAAAAFLAAAGIRAGARLHLEKRLPLAAGLGGGSSNAAHTLRGLNDLFEQPLTLPQLTVLAAQLGSDVPFFLQDRPALARSRGEQIVPLEDLPALHGLTLLLIYPGFGIATAWAYRALAWFPAALQGRPGRAEHLVACLRAGRLAEALGEFYNSLEAPAFRKYPLLTLFQEWLREQGALVTLMSGSGSATFALYRSQAAAEQARERFLGKFGAGNWTALVSL